MLQEQRLVLIAACLAASALPAAEIPRTPDWRVDCTGGTCRAEGEVRAADGSLLLRLEVPATGGLLTVTTPLPLHLPDGITVAAGEAPGWSAPWRTCGAGGCTADLPLDAGLEAALRRERTATVGLTLADGLRVRLTASLIGYSAAMGTLTAP